MNVCPLCNNLKVIAEPCPKCGTLMQDAGMLENFFGPYSPYLDEGILDQADGVGPGECVHLLSCPRCGFDKRIVVDRLLN